MVPKTRLCIWSSISIFVCLGWLFIAFPMRSDIPMPIPVGNSSQNTSHLGRSRRWEEKRADPPAEHRCLITQSGIDGIGHQLEGKLSCMAMALFLGLEYVHKPFFTMAHVSHPAKTAASFESFFGFWTQFRLLNLTAGRMQEVRRKLGSCSKGGWMRNVELGQAQCIKDDHRVVSGDNCWERMYCHGYMESGHFYKLVPKLHSAYYSSPKPDPKWTEGLSNQTWGPKVAIHIRQGDARDRLLPVGWYAAQIGMLRQHFQSRDPSRPPLFRIQTDDSTKHIETAPGLKGADVVIDGPGSPLELAIHRMITADALIMSKSALSMSAALIGNQSTIIQPDCWYRTSLPHWTRRSCA